MMMYEGWNTLKRTPGLVTWLLWVVLTTVGGILGTTIVVLNPNSNSFLNGLFIWFFLALPFFFVAVGQWLLLRHFVGESGRWLFTALLGIPFVLPYLLIYGFSAEFTDGKALIFGTREFWSASCSLAVLSLIFGGVVGLVQGVVINRFGKEPHRLRWWVIATAIAWAIGFPLGEQFIGSIFWLKPTPFPLTATWLIEGTKWGIIGAITGTALLWLGRAKGNTQ